MNEENNHVKFVSYTGKYPNLCGGVLTLGIDGVKYSFGHNGYPFESWKTDGNFDSFWWTGGTCGFRNDYADEYVERDKWVISKDKIPEQFQKYYLEIEKVFNDNVPEGCCGGCL